LAVLALGHERVGLVTNDNGQTYPTPRRQGAPTALHDHSLTLSMADREAARGARLHAVATTAPARTATC
jgi:hypothetical protein